MTAAPELSAEYRADLETVEAYATTCRDSADRALATWLSTQVEVDVRDYPRWWAESLVAPCRHVCEYADRVGAFAERARSGKVAPDVLTTAATAIREMTK